MPESGYRERHILSGLAVQVTVVGLMVFTYTQAARQMNAKKENFIRLREQLAVAQKQVVREGPPDLSPALSRMAETQKRLLPPEALDELAASLESLAESRFGFLEVKTQVGSAQKSWAIPVGTQPPLQIELYPLELKGMATTREIASFLSAVADPQLHLLCSLELMTLSALPVEEPQPVGVELRWLVAASPSGSGTVPDMSQYSFPGAGPGAVVPHPIAAAAGPGAVAAWGGREEPFLSVFDHPSAFRIPGEYLEKFHLTGILWDPAAPTCLVNGILLKVGDEMDGYRVILITPRAVLLQKGKEEVFLRSP